MTVSLCVILPHSVDDVCELVYVILPHSVDDVCELVYVILPHSVTVSDTPS